MGETKTTNKLVPTYAVGVPAEASKPGYGYILRLGTLDVALETQVAPPDGFPGFTSAIPGWNVPKSGNQQGALLYARDRITLVAPKITQIVEAMDEWSADKLSVTTGWGGKTVQSAELKLTGGRVGYSFVNKADVSFGLGSTIVTGVEAKYVGGASMGALAGSDFKSFLGPKTDLGYGMTVSVKSGKVETSWDGRGGKFAESVNTVAMSTITLKAGSPTVQPGLAVRGLEVAIKTASVLAGVAATAAEGSGLAMQFDAGDLPASAGRLRTEMTVQFGFADAVAGLLAVTELLALVTAALMHRLAPLGPATSTLTLGPGSAKLEMGITKLGFSFENLVAPAVEAAEAALLEAMNKAAESELVLQAATAAASITGVGPVVAAVIASRADRAAVEIATSALQVQIGTAAADPIYNGTLKATKLDISAPVSLSLSSLTSLKLGVGPSSIEITPTGISIEAPSVTVKGVPSLSLEGVTTSLKGATSVAINSPATSFGP